MSTFYSDEPVLRMWKADPVTYTLAVAGEINRLREAILQAYKTIEYTSKHWPPSKAAIMEAMEILEPEVPEYLRAPKP